MTEKEIFNGVLNVNNKNNNVLYFEREIEGLNQEAVNENPRVAGKFIDLTKDKTIDSDAKNLLERLKEVKIGPCISAANKFKYKVLK